MMWRAPLCVAGDYLKKDLCLIPAEERRRQGEIGGNDKPRQCGDLLVMLGTGSNSYGIRSRHCSRTIPKVLGVGSRSHQDLG